MLLPWLLNIHARAPSSPVLVVGTHADKLNDTEFERRRLTMREKMKEMMRRPGFPMDVSFAEVSCFDEKQMTELRKKIKLLINKLVTWHHMIRRYHYFLLSSAKLRGQKIMGGLVPSNYLVSDCFPKCSNHHSVYYTLNVGFGGVD